MIRRDRQKGSDRFTVWKVGILFLASGIWIGGVITGRPAVTTTAIGVLVVGMLLAIADRFRGS